MTNNTINIDKRVLWVGGGILVLGGLYLLLRKKDDDKDDKPFTLSRLIPRTSRFCKHGDSYPLKYGSCGSRVADLQMLLKMKGANLGTTGKNGDGVDGMFGKKTQAALIQFLGKYTFTENDTERLTAISYGQ